MTKSHGVTRVCGAGWTAGSGWVGDDSGNSGNSYDITAPHNSAEFVAVITSACSAARRAALCWLWRLVCLLGCAAALTGGIAVAMPVEPVPALVLMDVTGKMAIDEVVNRFAAGEGRAAHTAKVMPIDQGRAVWYQLALPAVTDTAPRLLILPHPGLDRADLFTPHPNTPTHWRQQQAGDTLPVADWAIPNLYPAFMLPAELGARPPVYLRVTNIYPVSINWALVDAPTFLKGIKRWYLFLGIYVGLVLLTLGVSCVQGVVWREPLHHLFAAFVVVASLSQLTSTGLAGEYLWPQAAWWNDRALSTLPLASTVLMHLLFLRLLADKSPVGLSRWFVVLGALGVVAIVASLAPDRTRFVMWFAPYYSLCVLTYLLTAGWYTWRMPRVGGWVMAAMLCLASGAVFPIMRLLGFMPTTVETLYGAQVGVAFQIPLLMVALFLRSRHKRANLLRISALERVDPLTGMVNHRVLLQRLERLQNQRSPDAAVMRLRIGNIPAIRKAHGLEAAQAAIVQVGALAAAVVHEGDTVARHSEGDFVLLLKGPHTREELSEMGQRLIARGLSGTPALPAQLALNLKIAVATAPFEWAEPTALLHSMAGLIDGLARRSDTGLCFAGPGLFSQSGAAMPTSQRTRMPGTAPATGSST